MRYLLLALALSCNTMPRNDPFSEKNLEPRISTEKPDTAITASYPVTVKPVIFETAFFTGTKATLDSFPISFYSVNIGKINIESGKLIACDPVIMQDATPFVQSFPIGQFNVQLAIAKIDGDERVAFSRILFSDSIAAKWEFALHEGQSQVPIDGESLYGFGVDAGIALYIDKEANDALEKRRAGGEDIWTEVFIDKMNEHYRHTWTYVLHNFDKHNLASFSTGYGDGTYATYVGYDSQGKICRLLTDFGLVEWWGK